MLLRLTVSAPDGEHDVEINAHPDATVGAVLDALPAPVADRPCYVGAEPLERTDPVGGSPLLPGCTISVGAPGPDPRALPHGTVGALRFVTGPHAGRFVWLSQGTHQLGRDDDATVPIPDPRASRRHATLTVTPDGTATIDDDGSSNGTQVDGVTITHATPLPPRTLLTIGDLDLIWVPLPPRSPAPVRSDDGHLDFNRPFAHSPGVVPRRIDLPPVPPASGNGARIAMVTSMGTAVVMAVSMAVVSGQLLYMFTALLGPLGMGVTQALERRRERARAADLERARTALVPQLRQEYAEQSALLHARTPDHLALVAAASGHEPGMWTRKITQPDALVLRVGVGQRPADVELLGVTWPGMPEPVLRDVPLTVDLRSAGVLGVVGSPALTLELTRSLLLQLSCLLGPHELRIVVATTRGDDELAWTAWLPHTSAGEADIPCWIGNTRASVAARIAELAELVEARTATHRSGVVPRPTVVLILDGPLRDVPGMDAVLCDGPAVGVHTVAVDDHGINEARAEVHVADDGTLRVVTDTSAAAVTGRMERLTHAEVTRVARAIAPLRDRLTLSSVSNAIPYPLRYLDLLGIDRPTPGDVLRTWGTTPGPDLKVLLGADANGPVGIDLVHDGPHSVLGGATGAGKSVLLKTVITGLLLANRPDELNLFLVDFKGGGDLLPFEKCPHVVGMLLSTDEFDAAVEHRILTSLKAEEQRRQRLLSRHGGDIGAYWRAGCPDGPLPRLVLLFDEYGAVLNEFPTFITSLLSIASKGRSLGMHLLLSTQTFDSTTFPDRLRGNVSIRVSLRQEEAAASQTILDCPDAASIPKRLKGRGLIVKKPNPAFAFQSGYLGDPPPDGSVPPVTVRPAPFRDITEPRPDALPQRSGDVTDQDLLLAAIVDAAADRKLQAPTRPIRPLLPLDLAPVDLPELATDPLGPTEVAYGLWDRPDLQSQPAASFDLAATRRLLVTGGAQQGRTTFARALLIGVTTRFGPDDVHVYVIATRPGEYEAAQSLPHCGAVIGTGEPDRIRRLLTWLESEVATREAAPDGTRPTILVILDGWEYIENSEGPAVGEALRPTLLGLIESGPPVGVHVVPLGGPTLGHSKIAKRFETRLVLPFASADIRRSLVGTTAPLPATVPGRAVDASSGTHVQIANATADALADAVADAAPRVAQPSARPVVTFPPLPERIDVADVPHPGASEAGPGWIPLGIRGDDVRPWGLDPFGGGPHLLMVSGPPGSGRTSAAALVARGLLRRDAGVVVVASPSSPLPTLLAGEESVRVVTGPVVSDTELRAAAADLSRSRIAVVVDGVEDVVVETTQDRFGTPASTLLADIAASKGEVAGRSVLVLCGDGAAILSRRRRGIGTDVINQLGAAALLVLCPATQAFVRDHNLKLTADQLLGRPPGRGYLVTDQEVLLVQLALPPVPRATLDLDGPASAAAASAEVSS